MEENGRKKLQEFGYFDVVQSGSMVGIELHDISVVVIAFERDDSGLPKNLGVLVEYNPLRPGNYSKTLVTGRSDDEDPDVLSTAIREFKEESGYDVSDPERWCFLGFMTGSKLVDQEHPCFAVDITGLTPSEPSGDGSEAEKKSEFTVMTVREALDTNDCYVPTLFMRMFRYIYNVKDFARKDETEEIDVDAVRQELDLKALELDGVNGSLVVDEDGVPAIEYTVSKWSDEIGDTIPEEYKGVKIKIKILDGEPGNPGDGESERTDVAGAPEAQGEEPGAGEQGI